MPTINVYLSDWTYKEFLDLVERNSDEVPSVSAAIGRLASKWASLNDRTRGPRDWLTAVLQP